MESDQNKDVSAYAWYSTGEHRDDHTPIYLLRSCDQAKGEVKATVDDSWTALSLTEHLIQLRCNESCPSEADASAENPINVRSTIIDPVCFGATGSNTSRPRSEHLRDYLESLGIVKMSQLVATRRVAIARGTVLDTLGNEWNAVTSGAVHAEDLRSHVTMAVLGGPNAADATDAADSADTHIMWLLEALVQMHSHRTSQQFNMIRLLRGVRLARVVLTRFRHELSEVNVDEHSAVRFKEDGITSWTAVDDDADAKRTWVLALNSLAAICAQDDEEDGEGTSEIVAQLTRTADEQENEAVELALVVGWIVQSGFWSKKAIQASLLLDSVYEAGRTITSAGPKHALGAIAEVVDNWVQEGTLNLGADMTISIDDVAPLSDESAFDHEAEGVLKVPRLAEKRRVGRIRVYPGRGLDLPTAETVVLRRGGRARVRVVGGALVRTPGWRAEKLKARAELSLLAGAPVVSVAAEMEAGRQDAGVMEEYAVNGMLEGAFGRDAALWALGQLRRGALAVHPDTSVCYARRSTLRTKESAPLVDAGLSPECVQMLHSYTDGEKVFVDFENNGRLRSVRVHRDGFLTVLSEAAEYDAERLAECTIVSRRQMR